MKEVLRILLLKGRGLFISLMEWYTKENSEQGNAQAQEYRHTQMGRSMMVNLKMMSSTDRGISNGLMDIGMLVLLITLN